MSNKLGIPVSNNFVPLTDGSTMPAGTIISYAGSIAAFTSISSDGTTLIVKDGWAVCNGASILQTTYSQLFTRIATTWNTCRNQGTGSNYSAPTSGYFRIPDLRGVFLRSEGTSTGYSATTLGATQDDGTAKNGLAVTNSAVTTGTESATHTHLPQQNTLFFTGEGIPGVQGASNGCRQRYELSGRESDTQSANHTHNVTTNVSLGNGDAETRPVNVGVYYLIKLYDNLAAVDVYVPAASATVAGIVDTGAQSFAGVKNYTDGIKVASGSTLAVYTEGVEGDLGAITWTGTAPSGGIQYKKYRYNRVGNQVFLTFRLAYQVAGTTNTQAYFSLTGLGLPMPASFTGDGDGQFMAYRGVCDLSSSQGAKGNTGLVSILRSSSSAAVIYCDMAVGVNAVFLSGNIVYTV